MIDRNRIYSNLLSTIKKGNPAVALLGPRQCGKTTLARKVAKENSTTYFDLEDARHLLPALSSPF